MWDVLVHLQTWVKRNASDIQYKYIFSAFVKRLTNLLRNLKNFIKKNIKKRIYYNIKVLLKYKIACAK